MKFHEGFQSRRSVVMGRRAMAASSQPLAVEAAINAMRRGGNAIDAAVAATAVLGVVEPMSTGLGGDLFALIHLAKENRLIALNGSGRASLSASAEALLEGGLPRMPTDGPLTVTVPGALDALSQCLATHGTMTLRDTFAPAIFYAENGFPVTEVVAQQWGRTAAKLRHKESARVFLPEGRAPLPGELFRNPDLARTLELIAESGTNVFYRGVLGEKIVESLDEADGAISLEDLVAHASEWVEPIRTSYRGFEVVEIPPNTQGLAVLVALNVLEGYPLGRMTHNSPEYLHYLIEATKLGLTDAHSFVADGVDAGLIERLLSKQRAQSLRNQIHTAGRGGTMGAPRLDNAGDTVYVAAVDQDGNVVSMISSLYKAFGSGITVPRTGLLLQNRGAGFSLEPSHSNRLEPGKRPFHTIIPSMILWDGRPWACFGLVGGLMQAQGHIQVVCNLVDSEMNPQAALDAPRFRVLEDGCVALESGIQEDSVEKLKQMGHRLSSDRTEEGFGGGQIILISDEALYGGSDPRKDGCAVGY